MQEFQPSKRYSRTASAFLLAAVAFSPVLGGANGSNPPVRARNAMVVSQEKLASEIGVQILKRGGNAVDAAVAVGFALAVTYPEAGNIGGGGFMVIRLTDGTTTTIDYRETAPSRASRDMYLDGHGNVVPAKSLLGHLSCGVPGSVAGLLYALEHFGKLNRRAVLEPAVRLARDGFAVDSHLAKQLDSYAGSHAKFFSTQKVFWKNDHPLRTDDTLVQHDLAQTLQRVRDQGVDGFYKGKTADLIVAEMRGGSGLITHKDLEAYKPVERKPVRGSYRGYEIVSMGPSSSGGVLLIQLLNLLEKFSFAKTDFAAPRTISLMAEAMKLVYADRSEYLGDPDFYPVPLERLISKEYANQRLKFLDSTRATPSSKISYGEKLQREGTETTQYCVVDDHGNAVSVTTTLNELFGSQVVVEGAGFFLNDEMDDFSSKPGVPNLFGLVGGEANCIQPGKRMLSAMTPTIVFKDNAPFLLVGARGGSRIITAVLQVLVRVIDYGMDIQDALDAPRVHHQWKPDTLYYEHQGLSGDVIERLKVRGYSVAERNGTIGIAEGILIDKEHGWIYGGIDSRGTGYASGY